MPIPHLVAAILTCPIENARYQLRTAPEITAVFRPVPTSGDWRNGVAFRIAIGSSGRHYWFLPWNGGTDQIQHLASTRDPEGAGWTPINPDSGPRPLGDIDYIGTDARYTVLPSAPARSDTAPAHILLPNLGDALWHQPTEVKDSVPKQFFDLVACAKLKPGAGPG